MITQKGMTVIELMVSVVVMLIVIGGASAAYVKLLKGFKTQSKISESYVENLCGLELLRYDIEMAGYALPRGLNSVNFTEATSVSGTPTPSSFNDAPSNIPRAFAFSNNGSTGSNNSDVLTIKSMVANINVTSKKWSLIYYDTGTSNWKVKKWNDSKLDFVNNERFIVLDPSKVLQKNGTNWSFSFSTNYYTNISGAIPVPADNNGIYLIYGIDPDTNLSIPFNRADYYLFRPGSNFPSRCYPNSYVLYRSTINQNGGARNAQPLLDCVMDFQVAFGLDTDGDRTVNAWIDDLSSLADANGNGTADEIRQQVRQVNVSILYHEGQKDDSFRFSGSLNLGDVPASGVLPAVPTLSTFTPSGEALKYRWKVLKLSIKPMNLVQE